MNSTGPPLHPPTRSRARSIALAVSAVVHGAVLALWASLPEPPPPERPQLTLRPVEWIELSPVAAPTEPPPATEVAPPEPDTTPASPEPDEPKQPRAQPPSSRPGTPQSGEPPAAAVVQPSAPLAPEQPQGSSGVSLLGLRGSSTAATTDTKVLRPSLPPPTAPAVGPSSSYGAVAPGDGFVGGGGSDRAPRSLAEAGFKPRRNGKMVYTDRQSGFKATLLPDGRVKFRVTVTPSSMPGMAEAIRSAQGQELFQAQKKRLLEQTFELRLRMAIEYARDKMDRRLKGLYRELLDDWTDRTTPSAERRARLFDRWDECEEGVRVRLPGFEAADASELDAMRKAGGEQARATIERFIRRQLPTGSEDAYTAQELRRYNQKRRSQARFEPYSR